MRYITEFSEFLDKKENDILLDINDILLDLSDHGFSCTLMDKNNKEIIDNLEEINIHIHNRFGNFEFNKDVKETILRLYQYMRELGFKSELLTNFGIYDKFFIIRPDEGFRYLDGSLIDNNHKVMNIRMNFHKPHI